MDGGREATELAPGQTGSGETAGVSKGHCGGFHWSTRLMGPQGSQWRNQGQQWKAPKHFAPSTSKESICPLCANTLRYGLLLILNIKYCPMSKSFTCSVTWGEDLLSFAVKHHGVTHKTQSVQNTATHTQKKQTWLFMASLSIKTGQV